MAGDAAQDGTGGPGQQPAVVIEPWLAKKSVSLGQPASSATKAPPDIDGDDLKVSTAGQQGPAELFNLGLLYAHGGGGVAKDEKQAVELFRQAADQGHAAAQCSLGTCLAHGLGVAKDEKRAVELFSQAADQGHAAAQANLGVCYQVGRLGVAKNDQKAVELYRQAADQGHAGAQYNLAVCLAGRGVARDQKRAVELFRHAADQGDAGARYNLGVCFAEGVGVAKDEKRSVELYRQAADQGDAGAQFTLGNRFAAGRGVAKDEKQAAELYRQAADQGHAGAQFTLGVCYERGRGVVKDEASAITLYRQAAALGDADAQYNLALCHLRTVAKDRKLALDLFSQAASQGHARAQTVVSDLHKATRSDKGSGVAVDSPHSLAKVTPEVGSGARAQEPAPPGDNMLETAATEGQAEAKRRVQVAELEQDQRCFADTNGRLRARVTELEQDQRRSADAEARLRHDLRNKMAQARKLSRRHVGLMKRAAERLQQRLAQAATDKADLVRQVADATVAARQAEAARSTLNKQAAADCADLAARLAVTSKNAEAHQSAARTIEQAYSQAKAALATREGELAWFRGQYLDQVTDEGLPHLEDALQSTLDKVKEETVNRRIAAEKRKLEETHKRALEDEKKRVEDEAKKQHEANTTCFVCMDASKNCTLVPCGHVLCCPCALKVQTCPICRVAIQNRQQMFA